MNFEKREESPNFEKMKKKNARDIIILHMCTKKQPSYEVWFQRYGVRHNFLSFWAIFCPFTLPPNNQENQNFEKMKKSPGDATI